MLTIRMVTWFTNNIKHLANNIFDFWYINNYIIEKKNEKLINIIDTLGIIYILFLKINPINYQLTTFC